METDEVIKLVDNIYKVSLCDLLIVLFFFPLSIFFFSFVIFILEILHRTVCLVDQKRLHFRQTDAFHVNESF